MIGGLILFSLLLHAEKCVIKSRSFPVEDIEKCYGEFTYDPNSDEVKGTMKTMRQAISEYSFLDYLKNPPLSSGMKPIDLLAELDKLPLSTYKSTYEFYQALQSLVASARDAHFVFSPPCSKKMQQVFPYQLTIVNDEGALKLILAEHGSLPSLTKAANAKAGHVLTDGVVLNMTLGADFDEKKTPFDVLYEWADENVSGAKRSSNRFNRALFKSFGQLTGTEKGPKKVRMKVETEEDGVVDVTVDYVGYLNGLKTIDSLEAVCPMNTKETLDFTPFMTHKEIWDENERLIQENLDPLIDVERIPRLLSKERKNEDPEEPDYIEILYNEAVITAYYIPTENIGYLRIDKFVSEECSQFFVKSLRDFEAKKVEYLLIDLRSNGGGDISLLQQMVKLLWPNAYPYIPEFINKHSPWQTIYQSYIQTTDLQPVDPYYQKKVNTTSDFQTLTFKDTNKKSFKSKYTKRYRFGQGENYVPVAVDFHWNKTHNTRSTPLYPPEKTIILVDGLCGSACGIFAKIAKTLKVARVAYLGGYPMNKMPEDVDVGEFSGGSSVSVDTVINLSKDMNKTSPVDAFPRSTTTLTFTHTIDFSVDPKRKNQLWEFDPVRPSFHAKNYQKYPEEYEYQIKQLVDDVKGEFNKCEEGMFQSSTLCSKKNFLHQKYAYPCVNSSYSTAKCVHAGCEDGYFKRLGYCFKIPAMFLGTMGGLTWVQFLLITGGILAAAVLLLIVLPAGICCCCCCYRRRNSKKNYSYVAIND